MFTTRLMIFTGLAKFVSAFVLIAYPRSVPASELPRFDGVYIQDKSGDFMELKRVSFETFNVCSDEGSVGPLNVADSGQVANAPSIEFGSIESIFFRGREERLDFVSFAVDASSFLMPLKKNDFAVLTTPHPVLGPCEQSGMFEREIRQVDWEDESIVDASCGWPEDKFQVLSEFENTAQYFARESTPINTQASGSVIGFCGNPHIRLKGLFIRTNLGSYHIRYE